MKNAVFIIALLLSSTALAQEPDMAGVPGEPGGSWNEKLDPKEYTDRLTPDEEVIPEEVPQEPAPEPVYDPGCTPKAGIPQSLLNYFKKFNQPLPAQYCEGHSATEPDQQAHGSTPPEEEQTEPQPELEGDPNQQQQEPPVEEPEAPPPVQQLDPPPVREAILPQTVPYGFGGYYAPGRGLDIVAPFFQLHIAPHPRVVNRWNRRQARRYYRQQRRRW